MLSDFYYMLFAYEMYFLKQVLLYITNEVKNKLSFLNKPIQGKPQMFNN